MKAIIKFFQNQWDKSSLLGKATMFMMLAIVCGLFTPGLPIIFVIIYQDEILK